jgi:hypothetical protein
VQSSAATVEQYLASLPPDRRAVVSTVRDLVRRNIPDGYVEAMAYGMIGWGVPLSRYPNTYNGQPLGYVALAAQKNYYALYLTCANQDSADAQWLAEEFARAGKKMDMGKSCLRFKALDDLPLDAIGRFIARTSPEQFIAQYEQARASAYQGRTSAKPANAGRPTKSAKPAKTATRPARKPKS